jgi:hypothetical protein
MHRAYLFLLRPVDLQAYSSTHNGIINLGAVGCRHEQGAAGELIGQSLGSIIKAGVVRAVRQELQLAGRSLIVFSSSFHRFWQDK